MERSRPAGSPRRGRTRAWASFALLAVGLAGCRDQASLVVLNSSDQVVTAIFTPHGQDLLGGEQLPPQTFVTLPALDHDTARLPTLEAYTTSGSCARETRASGRWELRSQDLDPAGC